MKTHPDIPDYPEDSADMYMRATLPARHLLMLIAEARGRYGDDWGRHIVLDSQLAEPVDILISAAEQIADGALELVNSIRDFAEHEKRAEPQLAKGAT